MLLILRTTMDYIVPRHQETGQNKTIFGLKNQEQQQKADFSKHHCTTEQMSCKNVPSSSVRRILCDACLYNRIAVLKQLLRYQNRQKAIVGQGPQKLDNRAVE